MALACRKLVTDPDGWPRGWHGVEQAAECLRLNRRRVRQRCEWCWRHAGLARKIRGKWAISPDADPRLRGIEVESVRDNRQVGDMTRNGVPERYIRLAMKRREIVQGFWRFSGSATRSRMCCKASVTSLVE